MQGKRVSFCFCIRNIRTCGLDNKGREGGGKGGGGMDFDLSRTLLLLNNDL